LTVVRNAKHAGEHADDTANCATQHAADRPGRLAALLGSLLNALNHLRIHRRRRLRSIATNTPSAKRNPGCASAVGVMLIIIWSP